MTPPRVLISHASDDKSRFVIPFAAALRAAGIDVWLDKWEIQLGDSLVRKIFDEAIDKADAVILVVSAVSITKPWVREELDASMVAKITKGIRLIPVVLDGCEVPAPLRHLLWESVPDTSNLSEVINRVVAALFGVTNKPPLGEPPQYMSTQQPVIPDRTAQEAIVLKLFCDLALEKVDRFGIMTNEVVQRAEAIGLSRDQVVESATILSEVYDLEPSRVLSLVPHHYTVTTYGFIRCVSATLPQYHDAYAAVASSLVNSGNTTNQAIAAETGTNLLLVEQILELMKEKGFLQIEKCHERQWFVTNVSPRLRRVLAGA